LKQQQRRRAVRDAAVCLHPVGESARRLIWIPDHQACHAREIKPPEPPEKAKKRQSAPLPERFAK
jgi:hypothetical protein